MARAGNNIVADYVLSEPWRLLDCLAVMADCEVVFVGVHCSASELQRRERDRGDREAGLAAAQQHQVHAHGIYDIECDTTTATPRECAIQIKDFLAREQPPTAFDRLRALLLGDLLVSSRQPRSPCHLTSYARTSMPLGSPCLARPLVESGAGLECIALAYLTAAKD